MDFQNLTDLFLETLRRAHIYDVLRAQLPTLELDAVFEAKEELALAVKNALSVTMTVGIASFIPPCCSCSFPKSNPHHLLFICMFCIFGLPCPTICWCFVCLVPSLLGLWISNSTDTHYRFGSGSTSQECHE